MAGSILLSILSFLAVAILAGLSVYAVLPEATPPGIRLAVAIIAGIAGGVLFVVLLFRK